MTLKEELEAWIQVYNIEEHMGTHSFAWLKKTVEQVEALEDYNARLKDALNGLLQFARERESFGIDTDVQNRPYDDGEGSRQKGNPRGSAYGAGYSEASRNFITEIQRRMKGEP